MIFVTGAARSGTSLTTRILGEHGLNMGPLVNVLYENTAVRQNVLKPLISSLGGDPLGQHTFPVNRVSTFMDDHTDYVVRALGGTEPMLYKDAKLCLVWRAWAAAFPGAKWIIVRRDRERIIDSCIKTHFMKAHGHDRAAWGRWVDHHTEQFESMLQELDAIEIWPSDFINEPKVYKKVTDFAGIEFLEHIVTGCIDRGLYKQ